MHDLDPLDPDYVQDVLSKPPFINIPGVINVRDLGNYVSAKEPGQVIKPRYFIRSAELSAITEEGASYFACRSTPDSCNIREKQGQGARHHQSLRFALGYRNTEIQHAFARN